MAWAGLKIKKPAPAKTPIKLNSILNFSSNNLLYNRRRTLSKFKLHGDLLGVAKPENDKPIPPPIYDVDLIYKIMLNIVNDYLNEDVENSRYNYEKCINSSQKMTIKIKDKVKRLYYKRYRILCWLSIIEKGGQQIDYKMMTLIDPNMDNFIKYKYENANIYIIGIVFLVHKT